MRAQFHNTSGTANSIHGGGAGGGNNDSAGAAFVSCELQLEISKLKQICGTVVRREKDETSHSKGARFF
jgi:hypothetical protein